MKNMIKYKGYYGSVNYDPDEPIFYGKLEFIHALVSYEAKSASGIKKAFKEAVDDYLKLCVTENIEPEKPFKGSFNVRIGPELHEKVALHAVMHGISTNEFIKLAVQHEIQQQDRTD